ncbi:MAG: MarR family transcriptional regulator [Nocardia sp.]|uniref:MarR family winged helix-turn-helix transcriptional regulator n=1 Tax=Nocardia sp. TaxID=1821 RepID=UPI002638F486|nr:MarR family transcriptional regulator [Nocardia sp.]MCU1642918.1 MarR family transcriptional regulator [Nocardia sp.]
METPSEPRWLDHEERDAWIALESILMRLPTALDAHLQRDAGISHFDYLVLAGLSMVDDRTLRMSDLASFAGGSLSRLSQVVSRLEKRGWVTRRPDPTDGRFTIATLTAGGWDVVVAAAPGHVENVRCYVFDHLTRAQVRQLAVIGRRVVGAIDPQHPALVGLPGTDTGT